MARSPRVRQMNPGRNPLIAILPYGPSESAKSLRDDIISQGTHSLCLRRVGSTFRGRQGEMVVNWGNSTIPSETFHTICGAATTVLNRPASIAKASNKIEAFRALHEVGVPTVDWTVSEGVARAWVSEGALVYARTTLQGHSGEGIVMAHREPESIQGVGNAFTVGSTLPAARLYTKGIVAQRREFRIHVMNGVVTYVQQKKRAEGWQDNPAYSNVVRNYHTGWIYAAMDISPNQAAQEYAIAAVTALGLNFGAVDVITRRDQAWVLEVNTAPGLQGTNLEIYTNNFLRIFNGLPPEMAPNLVQREELPERTIETLQSESIILTPQVAIEQPAPQPVPPVPPAPQVVPPLVAHESYYWATLEGAHVIVQYNSEAEGFYIAGWEVPLINGVDGLVVDLSNPITR